MPSLSQVEEAWVEEWHEICDWVAEKGGPWGKWFSDQVLKRIHVNAPITMIFTLICVVVHILTLGGSAQTLSRWLAVQDRWNTMSVTQYTSFATHILAHSDYGHLRGNLTMLLLVGPGVEFHFGSRNVLNIIGIVSVVSAAVHILIGKENTHQLGASGVVFAFILLNSMVSAKEGQIPLAFVFTVALYMGEEFWLLIWPQDNVSHHAHLTGGLIGAAAGFYIHHQLNQQQQGKSSKTSQKKKAQTTTTVTERAADLLPAALGGKAKGSSKSKKKTK